MPTAEDPIWRLEAAPVPEAAAPLPEAVELADPLSDEDSTARQQQLQEQQNR